MKMVTMIIIVSSNWAAFSLECRWNPQETQEGYFERRNVAATSVHHFWCEQPATTLERRHDDYFVT